MMNAWAILGRMLPAWRHVVGQMQHDLYHIYTVDQHSLLVVKNLCRLRRSEHAHEYPLCTELMTALPNSWRLIVAGLFHDIGKGLGGGHEVIGAGKVGCILQAFRAFRARPRIHPLSRAQTPRHEPSGAKGRYFGPECG